MLTQLGVPRELRKVSPWQPDGSTCPWLVQETILSPPCSPARLSLSPTGSVTSSCRSALVPQAAFERKQERFEGRLSQELPALCSRKQPKEPEAAEDEFCKRLPCTWAVRASLRRRGEVGLPFLQRPLHLLTVLH